MKTSDAFKNTIQSYLEGRAATDELFAVSFAKEGNGIITRSSGGKAIQFQPR